MNIKLNMMYNLAMKKKKKNQVENFM